MNINKCPKSSVKHKIQKFRYKHETMKGVDINTLRKSKIQTSHYILANIYCMIEYPIIVIGLVGTGGGAGDTHSSKDFCLSAGTVFASSSGVWMTVLSSSFAFDGGLVVWNPDIVVCKLTMVRKALSLWWVRRSWPGIWKHFWQNHQDLLFSWVVFLGQHVLGDIEHCRNHMPFVWLIPHIGSNNTQCIELGRLAICLTVNGEFHWGVVSFHDCNRILWRDCSLFVQRAVVTRMYKCRGVGYNRLH